MKQAAVEPEAPRDRRYLRLLLVLLATATFFEGYDSAIAGVVLNDLAKSFHADTGELSWVVLVVGSGAFGAMFLMGLGDRFGRRPLLIGTTFGYALFTGLTATAGNPWLFVIYQFIARAFLIAELGVALTMVAEEFPADRRGRAVGILSAFGGLGVVAVAALYRVFAPTTLSWRGLYLVGVLPLLLVGVFRFKLRETAYWVALRNEGGVPERVPFGAVLKGPYRRQALLLSAVYFLTHVGMIAGIYWFTFFAQRERGFTPADVSTFLVTAYPLGMIGYFVAGWLQDRIGRRVTGTLFMVCGMMLGISMFQVPGKGQMFFFLILSVFFGLGITPIIGALAPELFPTEIRATAVALARSVFGTLGATIGPFVAGQLADPGYGPVGNIGDSVSIVLLAYLPAAILLWRLPETRGRDLAHVHAPDDPAEVVSGVADGGTRPD